MSLNKDQQSALSYLTDWWKCPSMYCVVDSKAGTGKSYLVNHVLKQLTNCVPILLCPTNEALAQLREKTTGDYLFKTIHSALGITPTTSKKDLEFEHRALPSLWEKYNLAVVDECSMVDDALLKLLVSTGVKIIFLGHSSQLPPIDTSRKRNDLCISPVFGRGWDTLVLSIPQRNVGRLWDYNGVVEQMIYDDTIQLPTDYNISNKALGEVLSDPSTKENLLKGRTKVAMWANTAIDRYNNKLRLILFGDKAKDHLFLPTDNIILTAPLVVIDDLERHSDYGLKNLIPLRDELTYLFSNAKGSVQKATKVIITLNKDISVECHRLDILVEDDYHTIFAMVNEEDRIAISQYYERLAWAAKTPNTRAKRYRERHFILSCFAVIKHSYTMSSHRLQGSSVPNVIVIRSDILRNPCKVERKKCFYVATSRSIENLMVYNGV